MESLDFVITTSMSAFALGIRLREVGPLRMFNGHIGTHVGILVPIQFGDNDTLAIAEMLGKLEINPLSDYQNNGYLGKRIVCVKRFAPFSNLGIQNQVVDQIITWWLEGKKYDTAGMLRFVMPFLKEKDSNFYCSEMIAYLMMVYGKYSGFKDDNRTPWDFQCCTDLETVKGSK